MGGEVNCHAKRSAKTKTIKTPDATCHLAQLRDRYNRSFLAADCIEAKRHEGFGEQVPSDMIGQSGRGKDSDYN